MSFILAKELFREVTFNSIFNILSCRPKNIYLNVGLKLMIIRQKFASLEIVRGLQAESKQWWVGGQSTDAQRCIPVKVEPRDASQSQSQSRPAANNIQWRIDELNVKPSTRKRADMAKSGNTVFVNSYADTKPDL